MTKYAQLEVGIEEIRNRRAVGIVAVPAAAIIGYQSVYNAVESFTNRDYLNGAIEGVCTLVFATMVIGGCWIVNNCRKQAASLRKKQEVAGGLE